MTIDFMIDPYIQYSGFKFTKSISSSSKKIILKEISITNSSKLTVRVSMC